MGRLMNERFFERWGVNTGEMRKRVVLMHSVRVLDSLGGSSASYYKEYARRYCKISPVGESERWRVEQINAIHTLQLIMRYVPGVQNNDLLVLLPDKTRFFNVEGAHDIEERHIITDVTALERIGLQVFTDAGGNLAAVPLGQRADVIFVSESQSASTSDSASTSLSASLAGGGA
jgi:hypothetical protein